MMFIPFFLNPQPKVLDTPSVSTVSMTINGAAPQIDVSRDLFGIFFEEINSAGEGGIYAEMLRNRELTVDQDPNKLEGWTFSSGTSGVDLSDKLNPNRASSILLTSTGQQSSYVENDGFWGLHLKEGEGYRLVVWTKGTGKLRALLEDHDALLSSAQLNGSDGWKRHEVILKPGVSTDVGRLKLMLEGKGESKIGYASLMPAKPWKGRANGMSPYLAQQVDAMHPAFVRFPGGCFIEGPKLDYRFRWQDTIGPIEQRPAMRHSFWGYSTSNGLGFHEFLQWSEDMGASALFVANVGLSHSDDVPLDQMQSRVDDILNSLQYAIGDRSTPFGAMRAKAGHPAPFPLKYVEIGNENGYSWSYGGPKGYYARYQLVYDAIKKAYPQLNLIADVPTPTKDDYIDEHYYDSPNWFWQNSHRYDTYSRTGPKIYVGEYAVTTNNKSGALDGALSEAAFMTGMERNSDVVKMASYAPLLENVHQYQWQPNAIIFDGSKAYGTPSYWVQNLFANNRPDVVLNTDVNAVPTKLPTIAGGVGFKTWDTSSEFKNVVVESDGKTLFSGPLTADSLNFQGGKWSVDDGVAHQTDHVENSRAFLKGINLKDGKPWKFSFDARAIDGSEGFMGVVGFEGDNRMLQWNVAGWGNTQTAFQRNDNLVGHPKPVKIVDGQWYHVDLIGENGIVRGYLDGKLVEELHELPAPDFAADAGFDKAKHQLVIKLVNGAETERQVDLRLLQMKLGNQAKIIQLSGTGQKDENSFENPFKISPRTSQIKWTGEERTVTVPPLSLLIVRVQAKMSPASQ